MSNIKKVKELLNIEDSKPKKDKFGNVFWRLSGVYHRKHGPAVFWASDNESEWYFLGQRHRDNGPAVESPTKKMWFNKGTLHRVDGPALDFASGRREWFIHGKRHRIDGPAVEYPNGEKEFWINDHQLTESEFNERIK